MMELSSRLPQMDPTKSNSLSRSPAKNKPTPRNQQLPVTTNGRISTPQEKSSKPSSSGKPKTTGTNRGVAPKIPVATPDQQLRMASDPMFDSDYLSPNDTFLEHDSDSHFFCAHEDEEILDEIATAPKPQIRTSQSGNKKTLKYANHLLSFEFPARERPPVTDYRRPQFAHAPFKRERFVQANFRFLVSKDGEYSDNILDPDSVIDWDLVELVVHPCRDAVICSICLESPKCPRIAKCGHVFCWPCILRLFSYHQGSSLAPCPVCLREKINLVDLRGVILQPVTKFCIGDTLTIRLLQRPKIATIMYDELAPSIPIDSKRPLASFESTSAVYNRMLITSKLMELFESESSKLKSYIDEANSAQEDVMFLEIANQMLKAEIEDIQKRVEKRLAQNNGLILQNHGNQALLAPIMRPSPKIKLSEILPDLLNASDCYFIYQSTDGQHIFIHPINYKYLSVQFGTEDRFPHVITTKIIDMESHTVDEKIRKRYPFLSHLPTSCEFFFALVDISSLLESDAAKHAFNDEVHKRFAEIRKSEDKERKKIEKNHAKHQQARNLTNSMDLFISAHHISQLPDINPPSLQESFPELEGSHSPMEQLPAPSPKKSVWSSGSLVSKLTAQEEFPALPIKDKPTMASSSTDLGNSAAGDSSSSKSKMQLGAWGQASVRTPLQHEIEQAKSTSAQVATKKKGKKTVLIL